MSLREENQDIEADFDGMLEGIVGRTIVGVDESDEEDNEIFFVLDDGTAFSVGYDEVDGLFMRTFVRDTSGYN